VNVLPQEGVERRPERERSTRETSSSPLRRTSERSCRALGGMSLGMVIDFD
jgi:hypothetical protein